MSNKASVLTLKLKTVLQKQSARYDVLMGVSKQHLLEYSGRDEQRLTKACKVVEVHYVMFITLL